MAYCARGDVPLFIGDVRFKAMVPGGTVNNVNSGRIETGADGSHSVCAAHYSLVVPPEANRTGREILAGALSPFSKNRTAVSAISATGWTMVEQM